MQQSEDPPQETTAKAALLTNEQQLEDALKLLAKSNNVEDLKIGAQMLYLYCLNIAKNPSVPRYRKIYTNNNTFRNKVGNLVGATEFLSAVGFVERTNCFEWADSDDGENSLVSKSRLDFALVALEMMKNGTVTKDDDAAVLPLESKERSLDEAAPPDSIGETVDLN
jgi:hypothetical protein